MFETNKLLKFELTSNYLSIEQNINLKEFCCSDQNYLRSSINDVTQFKNLTPIPFKNLKNKKKAEQGWTKDIRLSALILFLVSGRLSV